MIQDDNSPHVLLAQVVTDSVDLNTVAQAVQAGLESAAKTLKGLGAFYDAGGVAALMPVLVELDETFGPVAARPAAVAQACLDRVRGDLPALGGALVHVCHARTDQGGRVLVLALRVGAHGPILAERLGREVFARGGGAELPRRDHGPKGALLPGAWPSPRGSSLDAASLGGPLPPEVRSGLQALADSHAVSLRRLMLSIVGVLLYRYDGQERRRFAVGVGQSRAGEPQRPRPAERFIVDLRVTADDRIVDVLARIDMHRDAVCAIGATEDPAELTFTFVGADPCANRASVQTRASPADEPTGVTIIDAGDALTVWIDYDDERHDAEAVARIFANLVELCRGLVACPEEAVGRLRVLTAAERALILSNGWSGSYRPCDRQTLTASFSAVAAAQPQGVAIIDDGASMTYGELDRLANGLAHTLITAGAGPGKVVALLLERSPSFIVAVLATLKAGAIFLPLDGALPQERLAFMLSDADAQLLLIGEGNLAQAPAGSWSTLDLAHALAATGVGAEVGPDVPAKACDPCYIVYTSGSTGRPKAAVVEHQGVMNCLAWSARAFEITPCDRILLKENCSHDAALWEIFAPLCLGAAVVVIPPDRGLDLAYIVEVIRTRGVTIAYFFASMLSVFLDEAGLRGLSGLRHVLCGGEPLSMATLRRYQQRATAQLHIRYGQTEASIASVVWRADPAYTGATPPIGRPIDNVRTYIVDPRGELVPIGAIGELVVAGVSVGRGYLGRPDLTRERFGRDPFRLEPDWREIDQRTFRTGDLARLLPDGAVSLHGRIDGQVKINGRRIETEEVRAVLMASGRTRDACVFVGTAPSGARRLLATIVPAEEGDDLGELDRFVRATLPDYMAPSLVALSSLPRLPNGKIDLATLKAAAMASQVERRPPNIPDNALKPLERSIKRVAEELLAIKTLAPDANLFDLGADSLLIMRISARLDDLFGVRIPVSAIFQTPSVDGMAGYIRASLRAVGAQAGR